MPALPKEMVAIAVKTGASARAEVKTPPRFNAGDKVLARNINPATHTRLPRYVRGKHGVVQGNRGGFAFADTRAHGLGDQPQYVYSVRFEARELWGDDAPSRDAVYIDLWEAYIKPAT
jgi:nitrile hydratase